MANKFIEQDIINRHNEIWKDKENPIILTGRYKNKEGVIGTFDEVYENQDNHIEYKCFIHGLFWHSVNKDLQGRGCRSCGYINMGKKYQKNLVNMKFNKLFVLEKTKIDIKRQECVYLVKCDCGKEFEVLSGRLVSGNATQCYDCGMKQIGESNSICNNIEESLYFNYPELMLEWDYEKNNKLDINPKNIYPKSDKTSWWKCEYNHSWHTKISSRTNMKSNCPECARNRLESKGAKIITDYLNKNNINYIKEFRIKECKHIYSLFFDFAIFHDQEKIKLNYLIEYDGRQHYEPIKLFGGKEQFNINKKRDNTKNEYCRNNNIDLLRIPYWENKNIEYILNNYINKERECDTI